MRLSESKHELAQCLASVSILFKNQLFFIFDTASFLFSRHQLLPSKML